MPSDQKGASPAQVADLEARLSRGRASGRSPTCRVQELLGALARPSPPSAPSSCPEPSSFSSSLDSASAPAPPSSSSPARAPSTTRRSRGRRRSRAPGLRRGRSPLRCFRRTDQRAAIWCRAARAERRPGPGARGSRRSRRVARKVALGRGAAPRQAFASACRNFHAICGCPRRRSELPRGEPVAPELGVGRDRRRPGALVDQRQLSKYWPGPSFASSLPPAVTVASPSSMMKKPTPPDPSATTVDPAPKIRSLNDDASDWAGRDRRRGRAGSVRLSQACARF